MRRRRKDGLEVLSSWISYTSENDETTGLRLKEIAGGKDWSLLGINGNGAAAKAARCLMDLRGFIPTHTQLEEAAGAALEAAWMAWNDGNRAIKQLRSTAWKAALRQLNREYSQGRTGEKAGSGAAFGTDSIPLNRAELEMERAALEQWAARSNVFEKDPEELDARQVAILRRLAAVLDLDGKGRAAYADRCRYAFMVGILSGEDIHTAALDAGYSNAKSALESLRAGQVWERLGCDAPGGMARGCLSHNH